MDPRHLPSTPIVVYLTEDLVFPSQARGFASGLGLDLLCARNMAGLEERLQGATPALVLVDLAIRHLDMDHLVRDVRGEWGTATLVGYAPHVHEGLLARAEKAGFDRVMTRGQFHHQLREILAAATAEGSPRDSYEPIE